MSCTSLECQHFNTANFTPGQMNISLIFILIKKGYLKEIILFCTVSSKRMDPHLKHPFTAIVAGPTGCGKSTFVKTLLDHKINMIDPVPERVVWYYGEWQPLYETITDVEFVEGLPDIKALDGKKRTLIIIDDLMSETNQSVTNLFTKGSHHRNISVLYLVQNLEYVK